jgi:hypothetical protein
MKKIQFLCLILFIGIIACNSPTTDAEKIIPQKEINTAQNNKKEELKHETIIPIDSTVNITNTVLSMPKQTKLKSIAKSEEVAFLTEGSAPPEQNNFIPGFVRNEFYKVGNNYYFKRKVKQDEDSRVGCSGSENELSFTVTNPGDTFIIENENIKALNFKYQIIGGIYAEEAVTVLKGKVKGIMLPDHNWQITIDLWFKMKDLQLNKEIERHIIVNDKFIL